MKKHLTILVAFAGMGALLSLIASAQTKSSVPSGGNAENGQRIFVKDGCYQCHGYDGHGGTGPKLATNPTPLPAFIAYLRHPLPGGMPVYSSKVMSDAELADVWSYLKSIPAPQAVKDIPLLRDN